MLLNIIIPHKFLLSLLSISCLLNATESASVINVDSGTRNIYSVISGEGNLKKTGDGTLVLYAHNTFAGSTEVAGGSLFVNYEDTVGYIPGDVLVDPGTTFGGSAGGYMQGIGGKVTNRGTVVVGYAGVNGLQVGSYDQSPDSTLKIKFNMETQQQNHVNASFLISGATTLDGLLQLTPVGSPSLTASSTPYTCAILQAGSIQGEFAGFLVPDSDDVRYSLSYNPDSVVLNMQVLNDITFSDPITYKVVLQSIGILRANTAETIALDQHNATEAADATLSAATIAINSAQMSSSNISNTTNNFKQLNLASLGRADHKDRIHAVLHALSENGPINFEKDQHRLWLSPYTTVGRTDGASDKAGNHRWTLGTLAGYEYRSSVAKKRLVGLIIGGSTGLQSVAGTPGSWTRSKGVNVGAYGGTNFFENARAETVLLWIHNSLKKQRSGKDPIKGSYSALSNFKQDTLVADVQASYRFQLNESWSLRPNVGNTYFITSTGGATERNTPSPITTSATKNYTSQAYVGLGGRYEWKTDKKVYRITSVFEVGREYYKKGNPIKTTVDHSSQLPPLVSNASGVSKKVTTKYFTVNGALLDEEKGIKSTLSYSGQFANGTRNHSFMVKFESRF